MDALAWPVTEQVLRFKPRYEFGKPWFRATFSHMLAESEQNLRPPWPDLVIAVGRRPAMAAMEIKRRSEGHCKIVLIGRPRHRRAFDLCVVPGQFLVPQGAGICRVPWPFLMPDCAAIRRESQKWARALADLPKPVTAVFVGGATVPFVLGSREARHLLEQVRASTAGRGCIFLCTSRRTGHQATEELKALLSEDADRERIYMWQPESQQNPYLALLGLADRFVVTGDSLSMMIEVVQAGKPLALYIPPLGWRPRSLLARTSKRLLYRLDAATNRFEPRLIARALFRAGLINYARDLGMIHRGLLRSGRAVRLGDGYASQPEPLDFELGRAAQAVKALFSNYDVAQPQNNNPLPPPRIGGRM